MTEQDGVSKEVQWNGKEEAGLEEESEEEEDDSAGEDEGRTGYSLLSQGSSSDEEDITSCCLDEQDHQQVNTTPVGSQPVANDIRINDIDEVRQAMRGFTLPNLATPTWAQSVPEDVWKKALLEGLRTNKPHPPDPADPD